jgi:hypothetical protein
MGGGFWLGWAFATSTFLPVPAAGACAQLELVTDRMQARAMLQVLGLPDTTPPIGTVLATVHFDELPPPDW